jgi:hypothetical protein
MALILDTRGTRPLQSICASARARSSGSISDLLAVKPLTAPPGRARTAQKGGNMPTDPKLAANVEDIKRGIAADVQNAKTTIEQWIAATFPPAHGVAVTIALLQVGIESQLRITDNEEHSLKLIHRLFTDVMQRRRGPGSVILTAPPSSGRSVCHDQKQRQRNRHPSLE